jgi:predicted dehydrogenase
MARSEGMNYAPKGKSEPVVQPGEFKFAAAHLDHGHIYGQCNGLLDAGAEMKYVYDPDPEKVKAFQEVYPQAVAVDSLERILEDAEINLVSAAAIPCFRGPIGLKVLDAGKDYFTDKSPFTTLDQLEEARKKVKETGQKFMVYYAERLHQEAGFHAGELIKEGIIGEVIQVLIMAPHRLSKDKRPDWFFEKEKYGGILTDIGSHQFEQFLTYAGASDAKVNSARVENFASPDKPGLEDFGEASLTADTGASCYCRVDWFTPDGLGFWGDGRVFVIGKKGTMEVRKYCDVTREGSDKIFLVDGEEEKLIECKGRVAFPFFGQIILDCLNRTENAMTQEHAFKSAEISMIAQKMADEAREG